MGKITKKYTNGEITVVWKPDLCVHATNCFTELPKVFVPYERPWVNMKGASTNEIIATVGNCPTDALTFFWNNEGPKDKKEEKPTTEISIIKNGPFILKGSFKITDTDGNEIVTESTASLCRCGHTKNSPFCDGSHVDSGFKIDEGSDY
jgi:CDGSH-type Zn-finger protein/uncharacterized Fe-S cluster protein YjdI